MGFGGATAAMLTSLKNNSRRSKREAFDGWTSSDKKSKGIKVEAVSEEVLIEIRHKMKQQQKKARIRNLFIAIISLCISVFLIGVVFSYFQNDPGVSFVPYK